MQATLKYGNNTKIIFIMALLVCLAFIVNPAFAQTGGLEKPKSLLDTGILILHGLAIGTVTIATMWVGYKLLFKHAHLSDCVPIIGGGLLIGGAAEIAALIMS